MYQVMRKSFTSPHVHNFLRNSVLLKIYRFRGDFSEDNEIIHRPLATSKLKKFNDKLFGNILSLRDDQTKKKVLEIYVKINPEKTLKSIAVNYFLKLDSKKNASEENQFDECSVRTMSQAANTQKEEECGQPSGGKTEMRLIRGEPGKVIWGFVPKEWHNFFVPVTGYSGFYTFSLTFCTYLFSKEIYVCDHEYYNGLSMAILYIYCVKKYGSKLAKYLDKEVDAYEVHLNRGKSLSIESLKSCIANEVKNQESVDGQLVILKAKRENVHFQREAEFRRRQMEVYEAVKRKLDYQIAISNVKRKIQHKNLIHWVTEEVEKSLSPQLKEEYMKLCITDIQQMLKVDTEKEKK